MRTVNLHLEDDVHRNLELLKIMLGAHNLSETVSMLVTKTVKELKEKEK